MPASGARSGTAPSRSVRGAGDGRVGERVLTCGHPIVGQPAFRAAGNHTVPRYWCPTCRLFRRRK